MLYPASIPPWCALPRGGAGDGHASELRRGDEGFRTAILKGNLPNELSMFSVHGHLTGFSLLSGLCLFGNVRSRIMHVWQSGCWHSPTEVNSRRLSQMSHTSGSSTPDGPDDALRHGNEGGGMRANQHTS